MHYAVIMAGGSGQRLWPLSREHRPKQIINIFAGGFSIAVGLIILTTGIVTPTPTFVIKIASVGFGIFLLIIGALVVYNYSDIKKGRYYRGKWF